ncbi:MAG: Wzy polymerase domain-containing protein [Limnohabitans sp.]
MTPRPPFVAERPAAWGVLLATLLALPFVHPWAPGPVSNAVPLMLAWSCAALVLLFHRQMRTQDLAAGWAAAAVLASLIGMTQFLGLADSLAPWVHVPAYLGDAPGNLRQRNQQATLLAMGMLALLWGLRKGWTLTVTLPGLGVLAVGLAATGSRTGLLQLALVVLLSSWWWRQTWADAHQRRRLALHLGVLVLLYLLAAWGLPRVLDSLHGQQVHSALERMVGGEGCGGRGVLWSNVLYLIAQRPWTGWGWDELRYAHYITRYPGLRFCDILGNAHNLPLHLAFSFGVPVALSAVVLVLGLLWRARPWHARGAGAQLAWGVLAVIGLHSLLEFPLWYGPFQVAVLMSVGLLAGQGVTMRRPVLLPAIGALILACVTLVAWDYLRVRQIYLSPADRMALWRQDPLGAARGSWMFARTGAFAELTLTTVQPGNAHKVLQQSLAALHHSPEPRVLTRLIESAALTGHQALAEWHREQFRNVYPQAFAQSPWGLETAASAPP